MVWYARNVFFLWILNDYFDLILESKKMTSPRSERNKTANSALFAIDKYRVLSEDSIHHSNNNLQNQFC